MEKRAILDALELFGALLELDGANTFKVRAFENAARALEASDLDPAEAVAAGRLGEIPGIGPSIAAILAELVATGRCAELEDLRRRIPPGLLTMLRIPGLGPKKVRAVWKEMGIETVNHLAHAAADGSLAGLRGFGKKTCDKVLQGIHFLESGAGRFRLDVAAATADALLERLRTLPGVARVEVAGSLRRMKETVHDLDFVAVADDPRAVMGAFVALPGVAAVLGHGTAKSSIRLENGMQADLRCVTAAQFPHTLQHFTGSKEHNVRLRQLARARGLRMNEYGLFPLAPEEGAPGGEGPADDTGEDTPHAVAAAAASLPCADEAAVYRALGLAWIPPELREDMGEFDAAARGRVPRLVERGDLRGLLHNHSSWSDGRHTLREMAAACRALGMEYFGICDHSQAAAYANGLTPDRVRRQWDEIDALNAEFAAEAARGDAHVPFRILKGIEADILPDGRLDFADDGDLLVGFDFVVGSVHSVFTLGEREQTDRVLRAMENPHLTILGHPTGRLLLRREGFAIRLDEVIEAAAARGVAIEINASPYRLDLDWRWARKAAALGVRTDIDPDAHTADGLADLRFGLGIARKAGYPPDLVLSCLAPDEVVAFARARRG